MHITKISSLVGESPRGFTHVTWFGRLTNIPWPWTTKLPPGGCAAERNGHCELCGADWKPGWKMYPPCAMPRSEYLRLKALEG